MQKSNPNEENHSSKRLCNTERRNQKPEDTEVAENKSKRQMAQFLYSVVLKLRPKCTPLTQHSVHTLPDVLGCPACTKSHSQMAISQVSDNFVSSLEAQQNNVIALQLLDQ